MNQSERQSDWGTKEQYREQWTKLIRQYGTRYWQARLSEAESAANAYGRIWIILTPLLIYNDIRFLYGSYLPAVPFLAPAVWGAGMLFTLWAGFRQDELLPFIPAKRPAHYGATVLYGLLAAAFYGVIGVVAWSIIKSHVQSAAKHIAMAIEASPNPTTPPLLSPHSELDNGEVAVHEALSPAKFGEWKDELDAYLQDARMVTRAKDFQPLALNYGFANHMSPQSFVKFGYNRSLPQADFEALMSTPSKDEFDPHVEIIPENVDTESSSRSVTSELEDMTAQDGHETSISSTDLNAPEKRPIDPKADQDLEALYVLFRSGAISAEEFSALRARQARSNE